MSDIQVALAAMRADAQLWDTAADDLQGPISAVGGVTVTAADVSMWAADRGLDATYESARSQLQNLLQQGAENFRAIAGALRDSATTYQREDEAGRHTFESTY
ncbi:MAG TPA: hypothetical protein VHH34_01475 [Pseudonocardiaceae bacterium]|nr:hypothetical protein [Pseudonocardiaceae bacterium]